MKNLDYREYYRRNLPHFQPQGATILVNFRLAGSLPTEVIKRLKEENERLDIRILETKEHDERIKLREMMNRQHLDNWEDALHSTTHGPFYMREDPIAEIVSNSILFHDGEWFDVEAFSIMPNHVHLVITPLEKTDGVYYGLTKIMHNIKRNSAKQANKLLGRTGPFWQHESYDHYIRNHAEFQRIIEYVLQNPVKAGLVDDWTAWKWS